MKIHFRPYLWLLLGLALQMNLGFVAAPQPVGGHEQVLQSGKKPGIFRQLRTIKQIKRQLRAMTVRNGEKNGATAVVIGLALGVLAPLFLFSPAITFAGVVIIALLVLAGLIFSLIGYFNATSGWSRGAKWIKVLGIIGIVFNGLLTIGLLGLMLLALAFGG
ncbi:MAG: hypothetical protein SFV22_11090 [Saprospiraceae bacterium]|nr:hypothetical protein [Saprospiraceae bacterium]